MYDQHFERLQQLGYELRHTASIDGAVWLFVSSLTKGLDPDTKRRVFCVIINRLAAEVGINLGLDVVGQCAQCGDPFDMNMSGRPKIYCSNSCRQKAKRAKNREVLL